MSMQGGCLCGAIRYAIVGNRLNAVNCYCSMCRQAHGTAYSTHATFNPARLTWLQGQKNLVRMESSPGGVREFCADCGSHILVYGQSGDDALSVPAGTLDGDAMITLVAHIFVADCVSWHTIQDDLPRYDAWPPGYGSSQE